MENNQDVVESKPVVGKVTFYVDKYLRCKMLMMFLDSIITATSTAALTQLNMQVTWASVFYLILCLSIFAMRSLIQDAISVDDVTLLHKWQSHSWSFTKRPMWRWGFLLVVMCGSFAGLVVMGECHYEIDEDLDISSSNEVELQAAVRLFYVLASVDLFLTLMYLGLFLLAQRCLQGETTYLNKHGYNSETAELLCSKNMQDFVDSMHSVDFQVEMKNHDKDINELIVLHRRDETTQNKNSNPVLQDDPLFCFEFHPKGYLQLKMLTNYFDQMILATTTAALTQIQLDIPWSSACYIIFCVAVLAERGLVSDSFDIEDVLAKKRLCGSYWLSISRIPHGWRWFVIIPVMLVSFIGVFVSGHHYKVSDFSTNKIVHMYYLLASINLALSFMNTFIWRWIDLYVSRSNTLSCYRCEIAELLSSDEDKDDFVREILGRKGMVAISIKRTFFFLAKT